MKGGQGERENSSQIFDPHPFVPIKFQLDSKLYMQKKSNMNTCVRFIVHPRNYRESRINQDSPWSAFAPCSGQCDICSCPVLTVPHASEATKHTSAQGVPYEAAGHCKSEPGGPGNENVPQVLRLLGAKGDLPRNALNISLPQVRGVSREPKKRDAEAKGAALQTEMWFSAVGILSPRGYLAMPGDTFATLGEGATDIKWVEAQMLHIVQCTGAPAAATTKTSPAPNVTTAEMENPRCRPGNQNTTEE